MGVFALPRRADLAAMLRLAVPVVVVQVGMMLMGVVDTMVVGRVSASALAAVALGHVTIMSVWAFGFGLLLAMDPLVAQAVGARDRLAVRRMVQRGLVLAVLVAIPTVLALIPVAPLYRAFSQPPEVVPVAAGYVHRCLPGILPFYGFLVLRLSLQAMERMRPIVIVIVLANLVNLVLDVAMVHGKLGLPAMGAYGSAWATTASRTLLFLGLVVMARRHLAPLLGRPDREALRLRPLGRAVALGAPIGLQLTLEMAAFGVVALLMGGLGTVAMAAHQVTINLASLTFMVPLGVSAAAAVRVGHAVGRADGEGARRAAGAGLLCGASFMAGTALLFLGLPTLLAAAYTSQREVQELAASLIVIAGVFQVFDGLQVVSAGVLRGLGDTRTPMLLYVLGFWLVGMPVSVGLGFGLDLGPQGLWWGLVFGLGAVAILLLGRVAGRLSRPVARLVID